MKKNPRAQRLAVTMRPDRLQKVDRDRAMWHETPEEVAAGLEWGRRKAELLRWVRREMRRRLTRRQRRFIELRYFEGLTLREIAAREGVGPATVHRGVKRGLARLRRAARHGPDVRPPFDVRKGQKIECDEKKGCNSTLSLLRKRNGS